MRMRSRKYSAFEIDTLVSKALAVIRANTDPLIIYLFGSALGDNFDDSSDLDFLLVFRTKQEAASSRKLLYRQGHLFDRGVDFVFVDRISFESKSELGGVCFIAKQEGRQL